MKRFLTILCAMALCMIMSFASCADDSKKPNGNGGGSNTENSGGGAGDDWTDNY